MTCAYCGMYHPNTVCPKIKCVHANGTIEFHAPVFQQALSEEQIRKIIREELSRTPQNKKYDHSDDGMEDSFQECIRQGLI